MGREQKALIPHPRFPYSPPAVPDTPPVVRWAELPADVLPQIALHLKDIRGMATFARLCRATRRVSLSEELWRHLCTQQFGSLPPDLPSGCSWREVYRFHHQQFYALARRKPASSMRGLPRAGFSFRVPVLS